MSEISAGLYMRTRVLESRAPTLNYTSTSKGPQMKTPTSEPQSLEMLGMWNVYV